MTKSPNLMSELIRDSKTTLRKADNRPVKAQRHRYERRKVREMIRAGDWNQEEMLE